jgi:hypothetical protein
VVPAAAAALGDFATCNAQHSKSKALQPLFVRSCFSLLTLAHAHADTVDPGAFYVFTLTAMAVERIIMGQASNACLRSLACMCSLACRRRVSLHAFCWSATTCFTGGLNVSSSYSQQPNVASTGYMCWRLTARSHTVTGM